MIARLLGLAVAGLVAWRFLKRRGQPDGVVSIGWSDGSALTLGPDAPQRDEIVAIAREALRR